MTSGALLALLRAASGGQAALPLDTFDERLVRWVVETGLGPVLLRAAAHRVEAARLPLWSLVQAADLTARVITAEQLDAMTEIIDACEGKVPPLVLLKGMSIGEQHYPEPHLRPMRDIDVLIEDDAIGTIESILSKLGYAQPAQRPPAFYETHHHSAPFVHPDTGVWIDVHRALVASTSELREDTIFRVESLKAHLQPSMFRGRRVRRLSNELQVVHLSCHWAHRLQLVGGMVAMLDMIYLVKNAGAVQWRRIADWTEGSVASRYVYLLLTYLTTRRLLDLDPDILRRLRRSRSALDRLALQLGHRLIDRYVVDGRGSGRLVSERTLHRLWRMLVIREPAGGPHAEERLR